LWLCCVFNIHHRIIDTASSSPHYHQANLDPEKDLGCACWMAKHRYGGFMGPYAQLPPGYGGTTTNHDTATATTAQEEEGQGQQ
jgi:hypothetical protein